MVIGAGMAGMAAAARLRVKGHDVTVLEKSHSYGGKVGRVEHQGFVFDTGPSLLTLPAVYRDLFLKTGKALEESVDLQPLEPAFRYRFSDGTHVVMPGSGIGACAEALGDSLGGSAAEDWRDLMKHAARVWQITRRPVLESPLSGPKDLLRLARSPRDIAAVAPSRSLRSLGRKKLNDPRLVTLLDRYATYTGSDPRRAPAALVTVPYVEQTFGAWHLGGGIRTLADALYERAVERGVEFRFDTAVADVTTTEGRVTGVTDAFHHHWPADVVVANCDATTLYRELLRGGEPSTRSAMRRPLKDLDAATASLSGFVLMLAVAGKTPGIEHHNVWFPEDYDDEFDAVFGSRRHQARPVPDPTVYACVPRDPTMSPGHNEAWFILVNAPRHGDGSTGTVNWDEPGLAERYADRVLEVLAERGTDLRSRILWRRTRTPAELERETGAPGGSIYGTSSNGARAAFLRPSNVSPVNGLYLAGGSSHPGGGLPLVGMSAEIVSNAIGR